MLRDVEMGKVANERNRDRYNHIRDILTFLALFLLMAVGAMLVMAGQLSAETYMGFFAGGCVGAVARGGADRSRL